MADQLLLRMEVTPAAAVILIFHQRLSMPIYDLHHLPMEVIYRIFGPIILRSLFMALQLQAPRHQDILIAALR